MRITLRNRLHRVDHIAAATIRLLAADGTTVLASATTNASGVATLNLKGVPSGTFTCEIRAPHTYDGEVGPALLSAGPTPDRVYRPVTLSVVLTAAGLTTATPTNPQHANATIAAGQLQVDVQPVWMRSAKNSSRGQTISMIVVHHTACALGPAVSTFLAEKGPHYMIDTDGQIVKWVQDARAAWHAGDARWEGHADINARSIGIEIVHTTGDYPVAQYTALLELIARIRAGCPGVDAWSIVGHSDVGTNAAGRLGRKSGDPGPLFQWSRLESRGLGLGMVEGPPSQAIYAGFFQIEPNGSLRNGDNDAHHRFGGAVRTAITGAPIRELQEDLARIGYSVGTPDGDFGQKSHFAVIAFQEHFFAGGRGHKAPDGRVDFLTAALIKSVTAAAAVRAATPTLATGVAAPSLPAPAGVPAGVGP